MPRNALHVRLEPTTIARIPAFSPHPEDADNEKRHADPEKRP